MPVAKKAADPSANVQELPRPINQAHLVGRVAAAPEVTKLPSGDEVVTWRLVVEREGAQQAPYVDTLECAAWTARTRRSASAWHSGDIVSIEGALRRRFWRDAQGLRSRYEIEVSSVRRLVKAR